MLKEAGDMTLTWDIHQQVTVLEVSILILDKVRVHFALGPTFPGINGDIFRGGR